MPILSIDYGERRIGLAVSDPLDMLAHGLDTIDTRECADPIAEIEAAAQQHSVTKIVLGLPRKMDGTLGPAAARVQAFADELRGRLGLGVVLVDERLTTAQAHTKLKRVGMDRKKRSQRVDRIAAQILLQSYLDRSKRGGQR